MSWWIRLLDFLPRFRVEIKRGRIERIYRLDSTQFEECINKEVRIPRPLFLEDKVWIVHKDPGEEVKITPVK